MTDHNTLTAEKAATAAHNAQEAFNRRKTLEEIGYKPHPLGIFEAYLAHVYSTGIPKVDRTGKGTLSVFGYQMRFNLAEYFPLITTKFVPMKAVVLEQCWFLRGDSNIRWLQERGVTIWDEWADANGDLGPVYGVQWRSWPTPDGRHIDQIEEVIKTLKNNPDSRRIIVSAWNVADLEKMALMPCHAFFQFYVAGGKLSCQVYQRSADSFLGVPFNIPSYALLTHMIAQQCDLEVGEFIWTGGDCHIYSDHMTQTELLLSREPRPYPELVINHRPPSISDYEYSNFKLIGYNPHPKIPAPISK